jgi:2,4-dienoyl-CoA reductase-like NADH-dependent reductase (Old Yellow Enzyme family)
VPSYDRIFLSDAKSDRTDDRKAAERAKIAGFDGVEIHGANGYLIDSFLQSKTNHRTDSYGGGVENRYRFLAEIVEAILTVWPANRVGVRRILLVQKVTRIFRRIRNPKLFPKPWLD